MNKERILPRICIALQLLAAAVTVLFFAFNFPIVGHDSYFHLTNLDQYLQLRSEGVSFPHWTPNNFRGLGSSNLYFYPPMVYMVGAMFHLLGGTVEMALNRVALLSTVLSFVFIQCYLRVLKVPKAALLPASILYAIGPYAFFDAVIRSDISEYLSFAWVPVVFLGIEWSLRSRKLGSWDGLIAVVISAIGLALLTLTNIAILIIVLMCAGIMLFTRVQKGKIYSIIPFILGGFVSLICTSFYTLPVIYLRNAAQLNQLTERRILMPFAQNPLAHLLSGHEGSGSPLTLFYLFFAVFLCYAWFENWHHAHSRKSLAWGIIGLVVIIMHIPIIASPIARTIPFLSLVQFPSRFFIMLCFSYCVWFAIHFSGKWNRIALLYQGMSSLVVFLLAAVFVAHISYGTRYPLEHEIGWSLSAYAPIQASHDFETLKRLADIHWHDAELRAVDPISSDDTLRVLNRHGNYSTFWICLGSNTTVQFHRFYWPMWELIDDHNTIIPLSSDSNGLLRAVLPSGHYGLTLRLERSMAEQCGEQISLFGSLGFALIALVMAIRYHLTA